MRLTDPFGADPFRLRDPSTLAQGILGREAPTRLATGRQAIDADLTRSTPGTVKTSSLILADRRLFSSQWDSPVHGAAELIFLQYFSSSKTNSR